MGRDWAVLPPEAARERRQKVPEKELAKALLRRTATGSRYGKLMEVVVAPHEQTTSKLAINS